MVFGFLKKSFISGIMLRMELIYKAIENISLFIGILGVFFILLGSLKGALEYFTHYTTRYQQTRLTVGNNLIVGLDFLVCKDIIDTLLLDSGAEFWRDLVGLAVVVTIRIVLTLMIRKEIDDLEKKKNHKLK